MSVPLEPEKNDGSKTEGGEKKGQKSNGTSEKGEKISNTKTTKGENLEGEKCAQLRR